MNQRQNSRPTTSKHRPIKQNAATRLANAFSHHISYANRSGMHCKSSPTTRQATADISMPILDRRAESHP